MPETACNRFCNMVISILSIPILVIGIWLCYQHPSTSCETFLNTPIITLAVVILIFAGCCTKQCCTLVVPVAVLVLLGYTIFAFVVTGPGEGKPVPHRAYKEYKLDEYHPWFQRRVNDTKHWTGLKKCLVKNHVCTEFQDKYDEDSPAEFFSRKFSSIESGCCKPPYDCHFEYAKPTEWTKTNTSVYTNTDCNTWGNDPDVLCFNCQACKAGLVNDVKRKWKTAAIVTIIFVILIILPSMMKNVILDLAERLQHTLLGPFFSPLLSTSIYIQGVQQRFSTLISNNNIIQGAQQRLSPLISNNIIGGAQERLSPLLSSNNVIESAQQRLSPILSNNDIIQGAQQRITALPSNKNIIQSIQQKLRGPFISARQSNDDILV